jgi:hypothetical protein
VQIFQDLNGRSIRLTEERLQHILKHSEMEGQIEKIAETLASPDAIISSKYDSSVHLYHKFYKETPVTSKLLLVAVKFLENDAFIITAFFTDKEKRGEKIWSK